MHINLIPHPIIYIRPLVIKQAQRRVNKLKEQGIESQFVLVGRKGEQWFIRRPVPIAATFGTLHPSIIRDRTNCYNCLCYSTFVVVCCSYQPLPHTTNIYPPIPCFSYTSAWQCSSTFRRFRIGQLARCPISHWRSRRLRNHFHPIQQFDLVRYSPPSSYSFLYPLFLFFLYSPSHCSFSHSLSWSLDTILPFAPFCPCPYPGLRPRKTRSSK